MPPKGIAYLDGKIFDVSKLHELAFDMQTVKWPLSADYMHHPVWENRTPSECLYDLLHLKRIIDANISLPILVEPFFLRVIDGYHRIVKGILVEALTLRAKVLTPWIMKEAYIGELGIEKLDEHNQTIFGIRQISIKPVSTTRQQDLVSGF